MALSSRSFQEQMGVVAKWFTSWNECEQTVALSALMRKITLPQARFMQHVLSQIVASEKSDWEQQEVKANDSGFIRNLYNESKEIAVPQLLCCLPLLRPENVEAKREYLTIVRYVLLHSLENRCYLEEASQLVSYLLIHPALQADERASFTGWLSQVEMHYSQSGEPIYRPPAQPDSINFMDTLMSGSSQTTKATAFEQLSSFGGSQPWPHRDSGVGSELGEVMFDSGYGAGLAKDYLTVGSHIYSPVGSGNVTRGSLSGLGSELKQREHLPLQSSKSGPAALADLSPAVTWGNSPVPMSLPNGHRKLARTSSVAVKPATAESTTISNWLQCQQQPPALSINTKIAMSIETSGPLSPQGSVTSSGSGGSEGHNDDITTLVSGPGSGDNSGMKDIAAWLKSLRLHKYSYLFKSMTYDEMINVTEEWLETQKVTKGARNKLVLSIQKLQERSSILSKLEKNLSTLPGLKHALAEISTILSTPIRAYQVKEKLKSHAAVGKSDNEAKASVNDERDRSSYRFFNSQISDSEAIADDDLPGQITRVLGKVCSQLLVSPRCDDDTYTNYIQLLDRCLLHNAFSHDQHRKLTSWRQQVLMTCPQRFNAGLQRKGHMLLSHGSLKATSSQRTMKGQPSMTSLGQPRWSFGSGRPVLSSNTLTYTSSGGSVAMMPHDTLGLGDPSLSLVRPSLLDLPCKLPLTASRSAPPNTNNGLVDILDSSASDLELTARLDDLCLSMTEHALSGGLDSPSDTN